MNLAEQQQFRTTCFVSLVHLMFLNNERVVRRNHFFLIFVRLKSFTVYERSAQIKTHHSFVFEFLNYKFFRFRSKYHISLFLFSVFELQPESDGSRSGSSLSLRNVSGNDANNATGGSSSVQSPTHRGVHRSISASSTKPNRRASSGAETIRKLKGFGMLS